MIGINKRYAGRGWASLRRDELETTLDGLYSLSMSQILTAVKQEAGSKTPPITATFDPGRDVLWTALTRATVDPTTYGEDNSIKKAIKTLVQGAPLDQVAFEAVHKGLIFPNTNLEQLIANLSGDACGLPRFKDSRYQGLVGAQGTLILGWFQQYLVSPVAVRAHFDTNSQALAAEQKRYVESDIHHADRPRDLLAAGLVPPEMWPADIARDMVRAKVNVELTGAEADAYLAASNAAEKEAVIAEAKARIVTAAEQRALETARNAARTAADVVFTDAEADTYISADGAEAKEVVVATAKARIATAAEQLALETARNEARAAAEVELTDAEADTYIAANDDEAEKVVVATAKARILAAGDGGKA